MELKFVTNSYFKQLFHNLRPKLQYSKNRFFVTSHFGTLFVEPIYWPGCMLTGNTFMGNLMGNVFEKERLFQKLAIFWATLRDFLINIQRILKNMLTGLPTTVNSKLV